MTLWALAGLVVGWAFRPVVLQLGGVAPQVTVLQAAAFYAVAGILAVLARATHRALQQRRGHLSAQEAVNRLALAKSCVLVGALMTGAYAGYALSWAGVGAELAQERIVLSLVAALGAALSVAASLLLERACRVPEDDPAP